MKTFKTIGAIRSINGASPAKHIKSSKKQYSLMLEPFTLDGIYFDENYLKTTKKFYKDNTFDHYYCVGFNLAFQIEEI